jgi:hypothetical protein
MYGQSKKAQVYYDKSCPQCGLPNTGPPKYLAVNRFGSIPPKSTWHKIKCLKCGGPLYENEGEEIT